MKLNVEPKQVVILAGILSVGAYFFFTSGPDIPPEAKGQPSKRVATSSSVREQAPRAASAKRANTSLQDFKPSLKPPKEGLDAATTDSSLRSDLLAMVQKVNFTGGSRSLFDFGQTPKHPEPTPPPIPVGPVGGGKPDTVGEKPPPPHEGLKPVGSKKTPIPLKYYGYRGNPQHPSKRAFFLEGDDIRLASEGELISKRYRVIRIGLTSAVLEDTAQSYEQTLPLEEGQLGS